MMPNMDGPAVLARLRENPDTAKIPVIFITARASADERERLMALGAAAVIAKPFYPVKLAETVRRHLQSIKLASAGYDFAQRLRADATTLARFRDKLRNGADFHLRAGRIRVRSCTNSPARPACSTSGPSA